MTDDQIETQRYYGEWLRTTAKEMREQIKAITTPDNSFAGQHLLQNIEDAVLAVACLSAELAMLKTRSEVREAAWREVMREMAHKTIAEALE